MAFSPASPPPIGSGDEDDEFGSFEAVFDRSDAWQANTGVKHRIDLDKSLDPFQKSSSIDDSPDPALPSPFFSTKPATYATDEQVGFFASIPENRSVPSVCSTPDDSFNFFKFEKSREEPNTFPTKTSLADQEDSTIDESKTGIATDFFKAPSDNHDDFGDFAIFPSWDKTKEREGENNSWSAFSADDKTNETTDGGIHGTVSVSSVELKEDKDEGLFTQDDEWTTDVIAFNSSDSNEDSPGSETVIQTSLAENSMNYDYPAVNVLELRIETEINFEAFVEDDPDLSSQKELAFDFGPSLESETNEGVSCGFEAFETEENESEDHSFQIKDEFDSDENIPNVIRPEFSSGQFLDFDSFSDAPNGKVKSDSNDSLMELSLKAENHENDFGNFTEFGSESYNPFENFDDINDDECKNHGSGTSDSEDHCKTVDTKEKPVLDDSQLMADSESNDLDDQSLTRQETNASGSDSLAEDASPQDVEDLGDFADFGDCHKGTHHSGDSEPGASSVGEEVTVQNSDAVDSDFGRPDPIESSSGSVEGDNEFGDFADFGDFNNSKSNDGSNGEDSDQLFPPEGNGVNEPEETSQRNSESDSDFGDFADESDGFTSKITNQDSQMGGFANFGDDHGDDSGSDDFADFSSQTAGGGTTTEIRRSVSSRTFMLPVGEVIAECYGEEASDKLVNGESVISEDHLNGRSLMLTVNDIDAQFAVKTKWLDISSYSKLMNTLCLSSGGATSSSNTKTTSTPPKQQPGVDVDEFEVFGSVEPEALASQRLPEELNIPENPTPATPKIQKHADILSAYKKEKSKTVTPEAQAILDQLPDLSFMLSTVLMFPVKG